MVLGRRAWGDVVVHLMAEAKPDLHSRVDIILDDAGDLLTMGIVDGIETTADCGHDGCNPHRP